jgi:GNAT superfamily N-acetyltransferase
MPVFEIYPATALDNVEQLRNLLETSVVNPITNEVLFDEVEEILSSVEACRQSKSERYYAVAITSGKQALGLMGLQKPSESMLTYTRSDYPAEIINAYVLSAERGAGVGHSLLNHLEEKARELGHTEVVVNSGPRYMFSGWPFWRRMYSEPSAIAKDYYGPRFDAMIWRKSLTK